MIVSDKKISKLLKHIGNLDIDVLFDGKKYYVLGMNACFGGGFPFSYLADANFPTLIVQMVQKNNFIYLPLKLL